MDISICQDTNLCPHLAVLLRPIPGFPEDTTELKVSLPPCPSDTSGVISRAASTPGSAGPGPWRKAAVSMLPLIPPPASPDLTGHFLNAGGLQWAGGHLLSQMWLKEP